MYQSKEIYFQFKLQIKKPNHTLCTRETIKVTGKLKIKVGKGKPANQTKTKTASRDPNFNI